MYAVLDTIMESPLYDPEVYVTDKAQAVSEWQAHNVVYYVTNSIPSAEILLENAGYENANGRARSVDLNRTLSTKDSILYDLAAFVDVLF